MTATKQQNIVATSKLTVNYDRSIADSVKAGKYASSHVNLNNENCVSAETGQRELDVAEFQFHDCTPCTEAALHEMDKAGYRPATMKELLAYGEKNSGKRSGTWVVALSVVATINKVRLAGFLHEDDANFFYYDHTWGGGVTLLGVRKETKVE